MELIDLVGKTFSRLTVAARAARPRGVTNGTYWECRCDCGNSKIVSGGNLHGGNVRSCGCLRREKPQSSIITEEIFWTRVEKAAGCWSWIGALDKCGYGKVSFMDEQLAHRASWRLHFGPIAPGMLVCHHCDNPKCVNPAHLFLGTQVDNMRDMRIKHRRKGRGIGEANGRAVLTWEKVNAIRAEYRRGTKGNSSQPGLSRKYGISQTMIGLIVNGRAWPSADAATT